MGVDIRIGKNDHYSRYKVYKTKIDIHDHIAHSQNFVGIIHAKDITPYTNARSQYGGFQGQTTTATIETTDKLQIKPNWAIYSLTEKEWYIVESVNEESHNQSQQFSARPVITRTIGIRK